MDQREVFQFCTEAKLVMKVSWKTDVGIGVRDNVCRDFSHAISRHLKAQLRLNTTASAIEIEKAARVLKKAEVY